MSMFFTVDRNHKEPPPQYPCQFCYVSNARKQCSGCRVARYCKQEHSKADWPRHKAECRFIASGGMNPDSNERLTVKAVFFPASGGPPRLVDVTYMLRSNPRYPSIMRYAPDWDRWFGATRPWPITIQRAGKDGPSLDRSMTIVYNENFLLDGSPLNRCIQSLVDGEYHPWAGDFLVFRDRKPYQIAQFDDANLQEDVPILVRYFKECNGDHLLEHTTDFSSWVFAN